MAAREVPAPRYGLAGSCRSFPEPAFPARTFLGMRSQGCWFGAPARMVGIWGKWMGPLLRLTPSPPPTGWTRLSGVAVARHEGRHLAVHLQLWKRVSQPRASPLLLRVCRGMMLPWVSGRKKKKKKKKEGGKKFPARARQPEPSLSLANLRPHTSRVKRAERAVCAKVNTGCTCPQAPVRGSTIDGLFLS